MWAKLSSSIVLLPQQQPAAAFFSIANTSTSSASSVCFTRHTIQDTGVLLSSHLFARFCSITQPNIRHIYHQPVQQYTIIEVAQQRVTTITITTTTTTTNTMKHRPILLASISCSLVFIALLQLYTAVQPATGQLSTFAEKLPSFGEFKRIYGKIYASSQEDSRRERIFNKTLTKIDKHNRLFNDGRATYALYPCEYSDMDEQEVATFLKGIILPDDVLDPEEFNKTLQQANNGGKRQRRETLPEVVDYRTSGCLSLPKDQKFW